MLNIHTKENWKSKQGDQLALFFNWYKKLIIGRTELESFSNLIYLAEIGKLAGGLFHDILNPITAIRIYLENICEDEKMKNGKEVRQLKESSEKVEKLLDQIKQYIGEQNILKTFDTKTEVLNVISIMNYQVLKKNINMKNKLGNNLKCFGNPIKFQQIFLNLISNSIEAIDETLPDKEVVLESYVSKSYMYFVCKDNGSGMPDSILNKIFTPLYTTKSYGNGVGLATVKNIVETEFKGKIEVQSQLGKGTTFTIKIPINIMFYTSN